MMKRRQFISALGVTAIAWPLTAHAQQPATPVIGFLSSTPPDLFPEGLPAFRLGLSETGYVEGRNVAIEHRWQEGNYDRLSEFAADFVQRRVSVIVAVGAVPVTLAAKAATTTIPIVFSIGADPVQLGLVASLNRPGGNLTGITNLNTEVLPKRLELLHELVPKATKIAVLLNPTNRNAETQSKELQVAARFLGLELQIVDASSERDLEAAFASMSKIQVGGLVVTGDGVFVTRSHQLGTLAVRYRVPTIFQFRDFAAAGGLMSYGASRTNTIRLAGVYAGRILKGEKPTDLPVQQDTKIELIINLSTAKALGLDVPMSLLMRVNEVIE